PVGCGASRVRAPDGAGAPGAAPGAGAGWGRQSGAEAVRLSGLLWPDVVLMDLRMPGTDGVAATARITEAGSARVLVLTTSDSDGDILRAIEAGATGTCSRTPRARSSPKPPVAARLVTRVRRPAPPALTAREAEVLGSVSRGLSNSDMARQLGIGEATVKTHLLRAFEKLGVKDRTAAVVTALSRGVLPPV
ncbi:LuxR C-terminal-related transcriptional regulator, partial [Allokutzneria oryzae]